MNGGSWLDPRSKLIVFIAACLCTFSGMSQVQEITLLSLCLVVLLLCRKWKATLVAAGLFAGMSIGDLLLVDRLTGAAPVSGFAYLPCAAVSAAAVCILLCRDQNLYGGGIYQRFYGYAAAGGDYHSNGGDVSVRSDDE